MKHLYRFYTENIWNMLLFIVSMVISLFVTILSIFFIQSYTSNVWILRALCGITFSILPSLCCVLPNLKYAKLSYNKVSTFILATITTTLCILVIGLLLSLLFM